MREPSTEPVTAASSAAIAASLVIHPGAHVLDVALAHAVGAGGVLEGRRIVYGYETKATWVVVHQWVFATGSVHVNLTASCAVEDTPFVAPHSDGVVAGVVFGDGETAGETGGAVTDHGDGTR
ncbi:hypothetical protein ASF23_14810 [Curtobacterium sp. Leaf261]|nr:hypothetical protein ASF23_14810 [Curtobacterium sp. Leaf261]